MDIDTAHRTTARHSAGFRGSASGLVAEIDIAGVACLSDAVPDTWLERVRSYAAGLPADRHDVMIEGADAHALGFVRELTADPAVQSLTEAIARSAYPDADPADRRFDCALRVINGPDPERRPLWLHYDASVLTVVLPVEVPDVAPGQAGELVLFPNHRPYRRSVLTNVAEKIIRQSDTYRRRFQQRIRWGIDPEVVAMTPGNAYLFWGYRSYHVHPAVCARHPTRHRGAALQGRARRQPVPADRQGDSRLADPRRCHEPFRGPGLTGGQSG